MLVFLDILCMGFVIQIKDLDSSTSRGKWYVQFYANFFKTSKRFAIPHSTAYFSKGKLRAAELQFDFKFIFIQCHILSHEKTSLWRRFRKCMRKRCWLRRKTARIIFRCWRAVLGTLSEKSRIFPTAQLRAEQFTFSYRQSRLEVFWVLFPKKVPRRRHYCISMYEKRIVIISNYYP